MPPASLTRVALLLHGACALLPAQLIPRDLRLHTHSSRFAFLCTASLAHRLPRCVPTDAYSAYSIYVDCKLTHVALLSAKRMRPAYGLAYSLVTCLLHSTALRHTLVPRLLHSAALGMLLCIASCIAAAHNLVPCSLHRAALGHTPVLCSPHRRPLGLLNLPCLLRACPTCRSSHIPYSALSMLAFRPPWSTRAAALALRWR